VDGGPVGDGSTTADVSSDVAADADAFADAADSGPSDGADGAGGATGDETRCYVGAGGAMPTCTYPGYAPTVDLPCCFEVLADGGTCDDCTDLGSGCRTPDCNDCCHHAAVQNNCVDCLTHSDCSNGDKCLNNTCVPCSPTGADCPDAGGCDFCCSGHGVNGKCVQCVKNEDCQCNGFCRSNNTCACTPPGQPCVYTSSPDFCGDCCLGYATQTGSSPWMCDCVTSGHPCPSGQCRACCGGSSNGVCS
jgi:hypothetical protein